MTPIRGRIWVFGDHVDTDVMLPGNALRLEPEEACAYLFDAIHSGWSKEVGDGDIVVGGVGFGAGSARPVGALLRRIGISAVVAESMTSLFQRNCINAGLLALSVPGVASHCRQGDVMTIDLSRWELAVADRTIPLDPLPELVMELLEHGGVIAHLEAAGFFDRATED